MRASGKEWDYEYKPKLKYYDLSSLILEATELTARRFWVEDISR